ncbi:hypothetical protein [Lujinxingia litoralis]|uniref:alpha/beta hydrolase n=1 Tax=Lujinxingia litoralis TaxID=2211119 RepID=UPI001313D804|nr:hypothetical protein [Lujinxingia litoralis]
MREQPGYQGVVKGWIRVVAGLCVGLWAWTLVGCEASSDPVPLADTGETGPEEVAGEFCELYDVDGPYEVGVRTLRIDETHRMQVYYPAVEGSPLEQAAVDVREQMPEALGEALFDGQWRWMIEARHDAQVHENGGFGVVLFSHGPGGFAGQSADVLVKMASHGLVVAAPEQREWGLYQVLAKGAPAGDEALETLRRARQALEEDEALGEVIESDQVVVVGHSAGARAAAEMLHDSGVRGAVFWNSSTVVAVEDRSVMWIVGEADLLATPARVRSRRDMSVTRGRLVEVGGMGHLSSTRVCEVAGGPHALVARLVDEGVEVPPIVALTLTRSCEAATLSRGRAQEVVAHYTTAQALEAMGRSLPAEALGPDSAECFGDVVLAFEPE